MDIKEYISSGIIENYVLGLVSETERNEVLRMKALHPEVEEAITAYEKTLEEYSNLHAVRVPKDFKSEVMKAIREEKNKQAVPLEESENNKYLHQMKIWRRIAAAAIILLIISIGILSVYLPKYYDYKKRYTLLVDNQQQILAQNQALETRLEKIEGNLQVLMNPKMKPVIMKGVNHHEGSIATVFWNTENRQTFLGKINLPTPPEGKAYQLWAIVDGKPVSLGMYNPKTDREPKAMNRVISGHVKAFAITLEKAGGSPGPTMDQMYVMGSNS